MSARFGQNLRALRKRAGVSQRALAKRLGFAGPSTISLWESGRKLPTPRSVTTLATALRCTPADLLAGVATPYDVLRGQRDLPGPGLLLSEDETAIITMYRDLDPGWQSALRDRLLPVFVDASRQGHRPRRRR